ncbi:MAG: hypothetical protein AYK18_17030 [Theionarchaea archaeon DG-70]|nr:MAG: hypothetical protein AYK18_17030 [Theionarchaea archaeon DG-70]
MVTSLGFKLLVVLPTFLFLTNFCFRIVVEKRNLENILKKEEFKRLLPDLTLNFYFMFSLESVVVLMINGIILVFEFEKTEIGILAIMTGMIFCLTILVGIYGLSRISLIGILGVFGILIGEFTYFCFFDTILFVDQYLRYAMITISIICGILLGTYILLKALPIVLMDILEQSARSATEMIIRRLLQILDNQ